MRPEQVVLYPLMTEKAIDLIERENKLIFVVNRNAGKRDVATAVEELYRVEVEKVQTMITRTGLKRAYVRLSPAHNASDLAIKLGIL
jgi:large subunit ribosomal protein L23